MRGEKEGKAEEKRRYYEPGEMFVSKDLKGRRIYRYTDGYDFHCRLAMDKMELKLDPEDFSEEEI